MNKTDLIQNAKNIIDIEIKGIEVLKNNIDNEFLKAIDILTKHSGKVIVSGIGKSGHIANKIAATLASTGTPSFFIHPTEALHGDLGMISKNDVVLMISNSGMSKEIMGIVNYCLKLKIPLIAITNNPNSDLAKAAQATLLLPKVPEACPLGKAPTTSTTLSLVIGDVIAITLLNLKDFKYEDFKIFHPGGSLGASLMKVKEIMHKGNSIPMVLTGTKMSEAIINITSKKFGCTAVVDNNKTMIGIITDGDIRRHMSNNFLDLTVENVMTKSFSYITEDIFVSKALALMQQKSITNLYVLSSLKEPIGILHIHDFTSLGVI